MLATMCLVSMPQGMLVKVLCKISMVCAGFAQTFLMLTWELIRMKVALL